MTMFYYLSAFSALAFLVCIPDIVYRIHDFVHDYLCSMAVDKVTVKR